MIVWILVILGVVALDQVSKHLVMNFLDREEPFVIIDGIFRFTYVENTGAAFGSFSEHRWVFMIVSTIGIIAMFIYLWKFRPQSKIACAALSMIIGGGIGNMVDRCLYKNASGQNVVIDFIDFCAFPEIWPWVFNIADSFVCVGAGILIVWCIYSLIVEIVKGKNKKTVVADGAANNADDAAGENTVNGEEPKAEATEEKEETNGETK